MSQAWPRQAGERTRRLSARLGRLAAAALVSLPGCSFDSEPPPPAVRPGIEVLARDSAHLLRGLRVGLITNHTGRGRNGETDAHMLMDAGIRLVALFAPEHGLNGRLPGGTVVEDERDPDTGLPVRSLYGSRLPPDSLLAGLDALVFDVQDIGARYYTYVSTMLEAMRAAAAQHLLFVVADRPNPIGGTLVQGNVLEPAFVSFVGAHPVAMRHGMTSGEVARMVNRELGLEARLHVVPASGWRRSQWADQTGLPWIPPSPNMPDLESAAHYPGTCLFEGTNLSVGRGTARPFQQVGAPWLDANRVVRRVSTLGLPGVSLAAVSFTPAHPDDGKYDGVPVRGVRLTVTDRRTYDPTRTAVALLVEIRESAPERWRWREDTFDRLAGTDALRLAIDAGESPERIFARWESELSTFRERRQEYLLYP